MIRASVAITASSLLLASCSLLGTDATTNEASPTPGDFCDAMSVAASAAAPAATTLDTLFDTMDTLAASAANDTDLQTLVKAGDDASLAAVAYVEALDDAQAKAPAELQQDLGTLSDYWELYVVGLAQLAGGAQAYGTFIDSASALQNSETVTGLIADQPVVQQRINDGYIAQCSAPAQNS